MKRLSGIVLAALLTGLGHARAEPITYSGFVLSDVKLNGHTYNGAQVYISFDADTSTALPFNDSTGYGYRNEVGTGRVKIVSGHHTISARFAPNQIYVFFDVANSSIGFGSNLSAGRGYPLALTALEYPGDPDGLTENSTIGAVSDILRTRGAAKSKYTPATATLTTNLANETALSGPASSCVAFDPKTSICSYLTPIALKTDRGDFLLYEPYTVDDSANPAIAQPHSVNWGIFWSAVGKDAENDDEP